MSETHDAEYKASTNIYVQLPIEKDCFNIGNDSSA